MRGNESDLRIPNRRMLLTGLATGLTAGLVGGVATPSFAATPALLTGRGDFRSIRIYSKRTDEWLNTVYWVEGQYIPEAMDAINNLMRDWRAEKVARIDRRTIDIIAGVHRMLETEEPFEVVSGYRSAATNAKLRSRSRGVARNSYHMKAMAADLKLKGRSVRQISGAAKALSAGGVGTYTRSQFVHVDSGPVRDWGR